MEWVFTYCFAIHFSLLALSATDLPIVLTTLLLYLPNLGINCTCLDSHFNLTIYLPLICLFALIYVGQLS